MGRYALIAEPDASRAAQYGFRVERKGLAPALTKSAAEALFELSRLGPPQLVLVEATLPDGDGLQLLRELRRFVTTEQARAILIVDARATHESAARLMIQLGISALLPRSHTMAALERAIDAALAGGPPSPSLPAPDEPSPDASAEVPVPEHLASHPLVRQLSATAGLRSVSEEALQQVAATTARAFGTPIVMLWLAFAGRSLLELHVNQAVPAASPLREPSRWNRLRTMLGPAPLHLPDISDTALFNGPAVPAGLASAPLIVGDVTVGGVVLFQPHVVGRLPPDVLEPLAFWAQRLSGDLERLAPSQPRDLSAPPPTALLLSRVQVLESLAATLDTGLLVSEPSGAACYANRALMQMLELTPTRLVGQSRALLLRNLSTARGAEDGVVSAIVGARLSVYREVTFAVQRPERRVLRWRGRALDLEEASGYLDEFRDVTAETDRAARREALVRVDAFTGLANRTAVDDALGREISRALRSGVPFSIVLFALDNLKLGDESAPGGETFRNVAWLLRSTARGHDLAARLDRLRLIVVLSETTGEQARLFTDRFLDEVRKMSSAGSPPVTVSGGVAQFDGERTVAELLKEATAKLAEARRLGGDRVV